MVRTILRARWLAVALLALCLPLVASAQDRGEDCPLLSAGNGIYTIHTWEEPGNSADRGGICSVGTYGVVTGPDHPSGEGLDLLQQGHRPGTSFNTVLSVSSNTAYALSGPLVGAGRGAASTIALGTFADADVVDETTLSITFDTLNFQTQEELEMVVEIQVFGTTIEDSRVRVQTTVTNLAEPPGAERGGDGSVLIAIRHLWDFAVETVGPVRDTGPALSTIPDFSYYEFEEDFLFSDLPDYYEAFANDGNPYYWPLGSGVTLGIEQATRGLSVQVPPTRIHYVCAPRAAADPFFYGVTPTLFVAGEDVNCSFDETGDSGVAYYWQDEGGAAERVSAGIELSPQESYTVDSWLWSEGFSPPQPELCLTLELDATQTSGNLGIPNLQNNDVVCGEDVLEQPNGTDFARGDDDPFELFFDGSDVGITRTIIDGMDILQPQSPPQNGDFARGNEEEPLDVLLSFNQSHSIPPIGLVLQSDIVRFVAEENGPNTAGSFERFFDGSDIGLQSGGENIDAFRFEEYGPASARGNGLAIGNLYFSTSGNLNIPGLAARDEDIVVCVGYYFSLLPTGDIESTCQEVLLFFDGSEAGLANASEDVDAFTFGIGDPFERGLAIDLALYLSTYGNFNVNDVNGRNEDVFVCHADVIPADRGGGFPITGCDAVAIVFDGSDHGLGSNNVYSIDLLEPVPVPCADRGNPCAARPLE
jgi:hypothetical protein